jgi:putative phosphoribosyl transferase
MAGLRSAGRRFADRPDAGRRLAEVVRDAGPYEQPIVLGLPRGGVPVGVPVAHPVAQALAAPLDVLVVRKLGAPSNEEVAMGAIGPGGIRVVDDRVVGMVGADDATLGRIEDVVLAVPVAPSGWRERIGPVADDFVAVREERDLWAVGQYYRDFRQTTDDEVLALLRD